MSEGLDKARSANLGTLVQLTDKQADTQSQNDFRAIKKQQNTTVDSGQPTASGGVDTKCSKHDMNDSAIETNQGANISNSDLGGRDGNGLKMFNSGNKQSKLNMHI